MTEFATTDSEFEFLQGSMKDLAMKMGEIEDVLAEITGPEEEAKQSHHQEEKENNTDGKENNDIGEKLDTSPSEENILPTPPADITFDTDDSDDDDSDDDDDGGLTDLQGELRQFEEMDRSQADAIVRAASGKVLIEKSIVVTANKPSPTSPVGVSMKTSKRITRIVGISETGLLANTDLRVGQILLQINDIAIKNAKHARYIIQNSSATVKFQTKQIEEEEAF